VSSKDSAAVKAYFLAQKGVEILATELKKEFPAEKYENLRILFTGSMRRDFFSPDVIWGELERAYFKVLK